MMRTLATALCTAALLLPSLAAADDATTPATLLSWSTGFGGERPAGYALALSYRGAEQSAPSIQMAEWRVADDIGIARVAGLPVLAHDYRTNQTDDPIAYGSSPLNWVWWLASGALVTVLVLDAADDDDAAPVSGTGSGG